MPANARFIVGVLVGYFIMPRIVLEVYGLIDKAKG